MMRNPLHWLASGGSALAAVVPSCPVCAAASTGLLSSLGLGFLAASGIAVWLVPQRRRVEPLVQIGRTGVTP